MWKLKKMCDQLLCELCNVYEGGVSICNLVVIIGWLYGFIYSMLCELGIMMCGCGGFNCCFWLC